MSCALKPEKTDPPGLGQEGLKLGDTPGDLSNLDILRALAVGLVFGGHILAALGIRGFSNMGHFGVLLFFVHTSLVLMMSMERTKLGGAALYRSFTIRRVFRLYPLSIACVLVFVLLKIPSVPWSDAPYTAPGASAITSNLFLVQNLTQDKSVNCVLWSLPFEVQMYAVLPLIYIFVTRRRRRPRAVLLLSIVSILIAVLEIMTRPQGGLILRYVPCFMAGVLAWTLLLSSRPRYRAAWWIVALVVLVVGYRTVGIIRVYGPDPTTWLSGGPRTDGGIWWPSEFDPARDWLFCFLTAALIPLFADCRVRAIVAPCKTIAKYSYGIYLWHIPVLWFVLSATGTSAGSRPLLALFTILGTALCAYVGYHVIEDPAVRMGKRIARRAVRGA